MVGVQSDDLIARPKESRSKAAPPVTAKGRDDLIRAAVAHNRAERAKDPDGEHPNDAVVAEVMRKIHELASAKGGVCWCTDSWMNGAVPGKQYEFFPDRVPGASKRVLQRVLCMLERAGLIRRHRGLTAILTAKLHGGVLPDGRYRVIELRSWQANIVSSLDQFRSALRKLVAKVPIVGRAFRAASPPSSPRQDILARTANQSLPSREGQAEGVRAAKPSPTSASYPASSSCSSGSSTRSVPEKNPTPREKDREMTPEERTAGAQACREARVELARKSEQHKAAQPDKAPRAPTQEPSSPESVARAGMFAYARSVLSKVVPGF